MGERCSAYELSSSLIGMCIYTREYGKYGDTNCDGWASHANYCSANGDPRVHTGRFGAACDVAGYTYGRCVEGVGHYSR